MSCAAVALGLSLTGCGSSGSTEIAEPAEPAASTPAPQQQVEQTTGVTISAGEASCEFNNKIDKQVSTLDPKSLPGTLDTATVSETADAYKVTFDGDFFSPDKLLTDTSDLNFQINFADADGKAIANLYTGYRSGELVGSGTVDDNAELQDFDTNPKLEDGSYTASFPKKILDGETPALWAPSVYYNPGAEDETAEQPGTAMWSCGDGRMWEWQPAE